MDAPAAADSEAVLRQAGFSDEMIAGFGAEGLV